MSKEITSAMAESVGYLPMTAEQHARCFALDMADLRSLREVTNYIRASNISEYIKTEWLAALARASA